MSLRKLYEGGSTKGQKYAKDASQISSLKFKRVGGYSGVITIPSALVKKLNLTDGEFILETMPDGRVVVVLGYVYDEAPEEHF